MLDTGQSPLRVSDLGSKIVGRSARAGEDMVVVVHVVLARGFALRAAASIEMTPCSFVALIHFRFPTYVWALTVYHLNRRQLVQDMLYLQGAHKVI